MKQQLFAASWEPPKTIVIGLKKYKEAKELCPALA